MGVPRAAGVGRPNDFHVIGGSEKKTSRFLLDLVAASAELLDLVAASAELLDLVATNADWDSADGT